MHILLTRPLEDSFEMISKFKLLGHKVSHLPLLEIESIDHEVINFAHYKAIVFTSANAIKFLNLRDIDKKILCFCVGASTEKKAKTVGFQNVISAEGNVRNLKEIILQNFDKKSGRIIYVSGDTISTELDRELLDEGININRLINYKTTHIKNYDENFVSELKLKMPDIVYIYSQNSALSFLEFIKMNKTENLWMNTNLMCISEKTSSILNEIKWKKIFLFHPGEEEFLLYKI